MIALVRGTLVEKAPNRVIVDVGGVGYDLQVPLSTFYVLGEPGTQASLRVHTHVREDVIALYGFATSLEQELFQRLIGISGIGPKLALAVLSGIEPAELIKAIRMQDVGRLTAIPGIGKKTAERIGLEMKDRLQQFAPPGGAESEPVRAADQARADLISALLNLGYQRQVAEQAVERQLERASGEPFEATLKQVLRALMKS